MTAEELKWAWDNDVPVVADGITYLRISEIIYFKDRYGAKRVAARCVDRHRSNSSTRVLAKSVDFSLERDRELCRTQIIQNEAVS